MSGPKGASPDEMWGDDEDLKSLNSGFTENESRRTYSDRPKRKSSGSRNNSFELDGCPPSYDPDIWATAERFKNGCAQYDMHLRAGLPVIYATLDRAIKRDKRLAGKSGYQVAEFIWTMVEVFLRHVWDGNRNLDLLSEFVGPAWDATVYQTWYKLHAPETNAKTSGEFRAPRVRQQNPDAPKRHRRPRVQAPKLTPKTTEEAKAHLARYRARMRENDAK